MYYSLFLVLLLAPQEIDLPTLPSIIIPEASVQTTPVSNPETTPFTGRRFWGNVVGTSQQEPGTREIRTQPLQQAVLPPQSEVLTLSGHTGPVETIAFSPDFRRLFSGGSDRQLILWDALSGEQLRKFRGHRTTVASIAVAKNGKNFVSCTPTDRRVLLWDVTVEASPEEFPTPPFEPSSVAVNSDATQVIVGLMDGQIAIYRKAENSLTTQGIAFKGHLMAINQVRFSPDERTFLTCGNDNAVLVWDALTHKPIQTFRKHRGAVLSADFSSDGQEIVSAGTDKTALVWTVADGEIKYRLPGHVGDITAVAFSSDGSEIFTASKDRTVVQWDAKTGEKKSTAPKRNSPILSAGLSEINNSIAVGCLNGTIEILAPSVFAPEKNAGEEFNAGNRNSPLPQDADVQKRKTLMDLPAGRVMFHYGTTSHYSDIGTISPNGFQFVSVNTSRGEGTLWEADTGKVARLLNYPQQISAAHFHTKDSNFLLTGSKHGAIQYWNFSHDNIADLPGHESSVQRIALTPDGTRFLSGAADGTVILWDVRLKQKLQTVQASTKRIRSLVFSPDGKRFAVGTDDKTVGLWTIESVEENLFTEQKLVGHDSGEISLVFSPDGRYLYSAAADGKAIQWEVASGNLLKEFQAHTDGIASIAISPNGQYLLTGGKTEEFSLLWDVNTAQPVMILPFQGGPVTAILFHPQIFNVITVGGRTPRLWNISGVQERK